MDLAVNNFTDIIQTAARSSTTAFLTPSKGSSIPIQNRETIVENVGLGLYGLYQCTRLPSLKQKYNNLANHPKKNSSQIQSQVV